MSLLKKYLTLSLLPLFAFSGCDTDAADPDPEYAFLWGDPAAVKSDIPEPGLVVTGYYYTNMTNDPTDEVGVVLYEYEYGKNGIKKGEYYGVVTPFAQGGGGEFTVSINELNPMAVYMGYMYAKIDGTTYFDPESQWFRFEMYRPDGNLVTGEGSPGNVEVEPPYDAYHTKEQYRWAELPVMKKMDEVMYVTHYVDDSGTKIVAPGTKGRVRNYTIAYDPSKMQPLWVAAPMHTFYWDPQGTKRTDEWDYDPYIPRDKQINSIAGSYNQHAPDGAFSKGHMVGSADRLRSKPMNWQTFYSTNMAPQNQSFNGGVWGSLEEKIRGWCASSADTVYVVTGVIFEGTKVTFDKGDDGKDDTSDDRELPVPSHFYKLVLAAKTQNAGTDTPIASLSASQLRCAAFVFPNQPASGVLSGYMDEVSDIESRVGFEFFPMLSAEAKSVKNSYNASDWNL